MLGDEATELVDVSIVAVLEDWREELSKVLVAMSLEVLVVNASVATKLEEWMIDVSLRTELEDWPVKLVKVAIPVGNLILRLVGKSPEYLPKTLVEVMSKDWTEEMLLVPSKKLGKV